jgi:hypothetical protein
MMPDFKIEVEEKSNYLSRSILPWSIEVLTFMGGTLCVKNICQFNWIGIILFIILIFIILNYLDDDVTRQKYFINLFEVKSDIIYIEYKDKMNPKEINGEKEDFVLQIRKTLYGRIPYLQVIYKGEIIIDQHCNGDWTESKLNDVIKRTKHD